MKFPLIIKIGSVIVKVYRGKVNRGKYDAFTVAYYENGRRQRSVFGNLDDAKTAAREIATKIAHGRANAIELNSLDREKYVNAVALLEPFSVSLNEAVEDYVAAREREQKTQDDKPVAELVEELLTAKKRDGLSVRHVRTLRSDLRRFAASFPTGIRSISSKMIEQWLHGLSVGARSRNNIRASIVNLFEYGRRHGYLPKDSHTEAEDVPRAKDRGGEIGILRPQELASLLRKADEEATLWLVLGAFAGLRTAEMFRLEWQDVDFERGHIIVGKDKSKTATRRIIPLPSNLVQWLAPYRGRTGQVFASNHVPDRVIGFAKQYVRWPQNCLRHSFISYRLAQTHDAPRTALEAGTSPQMLFRNYRELVTEVDAKTWFAIAPEKKADRKVVQFRR